MLPKQRMVIVTNERDHAVEYKGHGSSTIHQEDTLKAEHGKECHYFLCIEADPLLRDDHPDARSARRPRAARCSRTQRVIVPSLREGGPLPDHPQPGPQLGHLRDQHRRLRAPALAGQPPAGHGPGGHPDPGCLHRGQTAQYIERRFEVDRRRPFFYLQKKDHSWIIR
jgi:hypothetical protein